MRLGKLRDFVMGKKLILVLISFFLMFSLISLASATLTVGVKAGDWIEYQVTFTGTPPDPSHSVVEANMTSSERFRIIYQSKHHFNIIKRHPTFNQFYSKPTNWAIN